MQDKESAQQFMKFVNVLRKEKELSMKSLCEGLCSDRAKVSWENGTWKPSKLLQDAIMERLGIGAEDYEHFLGWREYDKWEARQHILHSITYGNIEKAGHLLKEYQEGYGKQSKLERQFCLSMEGQIRRSQGASREELQRIFREAVGLTVPELEQKPLRKLVLSIKELNLILELEQYREGGGREKKYHEIVEYIEQKRLDRCGMAKIFPKAVYFLCRSMMPVVDIPKAEELLLYCNKAIEVLRVNERMYYLWELLEIEQQLAKSGLRDMYQEHLDWEQILRETYDEFGVPKETWEFCYLYVEKGVHCISDVVRDRREMLGIAPEELCAGICDKKTLKRLEERERVTQTVILGKLFQRLGLSVEVSRTELVTSSQEARDLMEKLVYYINRGQWSEVDRLCGRIEGQVSMDDLSNQQVLMNKKVFSSWKKGEMAKEEYYRQVQEVLEITLPFKAFLQKGGKYLTKEEQVCIQNMMQAMDEKEEECLVCMERFEEMYLSYIERELQDTVSDMFEFIMGNVGSILGNRGEFDKSDKYNRLVIEGCLRFRRMGALHRSLYNRWWNNNERKNRDVLTHQALDDERELTRCILLSRLCREPRAERCWQTMLEKIYSK